MAFHVRLVRLIFQTRLVVGGIGEINISGEIDEINVSGEIDEIICRRHW